MTKKQLLVGALVVAVVALVYFKSNLIKDNAEDTGGTGGTGAVAYNCDGGKTFTLTSVDKDTVRVSGPGVTSTTLDKKITDYWISVDGKTSVKTVGTYVVLVQKDLVTHDRCAAK